MENKNNNVSVRGTIGFCDSLALVFIVLKLLGKITWSWIWVLSPIWIQFVLFIIIFIVLLIQIYWKNK